jgi:hypothetical protein
MQLIEVDIGMEYRTVGEILNINTKWSTIGIPSALRWIKSNRSCSHICFFAEYHLLLQGLLGGFPLSLSSFSLCRCQCQWRLRFTVINANEMSSVAAFLRSHTGHFVTGAFTLVATGAIL